MLNRKLAILLFIFVFLIVWGVVFYDYYKKQNSVSDQNILTGNVISDNLADSVMLSPSQLRECGIFSRCSNGYYCETRFSPDLCAPINRCATSAECLNKNYGFNCEFITVNRQRYKACRTECISDSYCLHQGEGGDLCNKNLGRCVECIKDDPTKQCKNPGETCNDKGECISSGTSSECSDGKDNDEDGLIDYPIDRGCISLSDNSEYNLPACNDDLDNDGDGLTDLSDPGCSSSSDDNENNIPACNDEQDNDGDGLTDLSDPGCSSSSDDNEEDTLPPPAQILCDPKTDKPCPSGQICRDDDNDGRGICVVDDDLHWPPPYPTDRPNDDGTINSQSENDQDTTNIDYELICSIAPELCEDLSCPDGESDNTGYSYFCQSSCTSGMPIGLTCVNSQLKCCRQKNVGQNDQCKSKYGNSASCQSTESCRNSRGTSYPGFCLAGGLQSDLNVQCCVPPSSGDTSKKCVSPISYTPIRFNSGIHNNAGHRPVRCGSSYCAVDLNPSDTCAGARTKALSGLTVVSPINGIVSEVFSISPFGSCIVINNANSDVNVAVLCHIDTTKNVGDHVNAGDNVGKLASWNCQPESFGPHLHFELKLNGNWISGDGMGGTWTNQKTTCNNYH